MMNLFRKILVFCLLFPVLAFAQDASQPALTGIAADQQARVAELTREVDRLDTDITENAENDARLVEIRLALESLQSAVLKSGVAFRPVLNDINTKLNALGDAPKDGEAAEDEAKAAQRAALNGQKAQINQVIGKAEDLLVRINGLVNKVSTVRRDLFTNTLLRRYELGEAVNTRVGAQIGDQLSMLKRNVDASLRFTARFKMQAMLAATGIALLSGIAFYLIARRYIGRIVHKDREAEPDYLARLGVAFWSTLLPSLALGLFVGLTLILYQSYNVLRGDVGDYLLGIVYTLFLCFFVNRLAHAVLSPDAPSWQLVKIEPAPARVLIWLVTLAALVVGTDSFIGIVTESLGSPLSVTILKGLVASIIVGVLLLLFGSVKPFAAPDGSTRPWPIWVRAIIYLFAFGIIGAALAGYISLALFTSRQVVVTGAWIATAYIGLLASRAISEEGAFAGTALGRWYKEKRHVEDSRLDQLGVLTSVIINLLLVLVFLPGILFQWGFQAGDISLWVHRLADGFQIGTFTFSPLAIITGLIVFGIGYVITRWFQSWIDGTVMARGRVDPGVRNSIRTVVGYAGLAIAALIAISAAGLNLSNLALIAGGLSLGIGFGLQNVVSNFVSGLILLAERPFKVGDWVVAGDVSGTVRKISVRATEIETFQRQTVIVPNSQLINNSVGNWTHRNRLGRVEVPVMVAYGSDVEQVHAILLDIARSCPHVLKNPEPFVLFSGFADTSVNFEIRVFLSDITNGSLVQNELRFGLVKAFDEAGIQLAHVPRPELAQQKAQEAGKDGELND